MKLCDYGCGKKAKHQLKNGKWCCGLSSHYLHTQDTTATVWTVVHNLGSKYVNVDVIVNDKSVQGTYDEPEIEFISTTTLTCTFSEDTVGYCSVWGNE